MAWEDKGRPPRRGGAGGFDQIPDAPDFDLNKLKTISFRPVHFALLAFALAAIYLFSGLYRVELQERAVVLLFGKHVATTEPGLRWNFPAPIGKVIKIRLEEIKKVEVGFRSGSSDLSSAELLKEAQMLTEGINMIDVQMSVQYQISDPAKFLFSISDPQFNRSGRPIGRNMRFLGDAGLSYTVRNVAEAALREVVGSSPIDDVLTVGRSKIQQEVHLLMQEILDKYNAGVTVNLVQLQDVFPPESVKQSFRDVNNAEEDMNRLIREAEGYNNAVIPQTRGQAAQIIAKAEAYKAEKVAMAQGDALRFESQLEEYRKAPDITRKRLFIETMEEVFYRVDKTIIDSKSLSSLMPLLPLEHRSKRGAPPMRAREGEVAQ